MKQEKKLNSVKTYNQWLSLIKYEIVKTKVIQLYDYFNKNKNLKLEIKWNNPMYTFDNKFIISFTVAKDHISVAPEKKVLEVFKNKILQSGYIIKSQTFTINNNLEINYSLLNEIIEFNIKDKINCKTFFRQKND